MKALEQACWKCASSREVTWSGEERGRHSQRQRERLTGLIVKMETQKRPGGEFQLGNVSILYDEPTE
ncbi:hypothetical protein U0070_013945 [Myodes glareolus]|uniref:Uncharacterized protein n=1 Tax=Myodes glareolus TaxID=447135 RepID=A0AAW0I1L4_MYOGA